MQCGTAFAHNSKFLTMILEVALLHVIPEKTAEFELAFENAQQIISSMEGYLDHQLQQCMERPNRYILLVNWKNLEDHVIGFRESPDYQQWKKLLHHFYDPFPEVEHYQLKFENRSVI
jgi:heme-degrading monooxygenase HmoA